MSRYQWRKSKKDPITPTSNTRPDHTSPRGFTSARRSRDCWTGLHLRLGHFSWLVRSVFCVVNLGDLVRAPAASNGKHAAIYQSRRGPEGGTETVPASIVVRLALCHVALGSKTPHQR